MNKMTKYLKEPKDVVCCHVGNALILPCVSKRKFEIVFWFPFLWHFEGWDVIDGFYILLCFVGKPFHQMYYNYVHKLMLSLWTLSLTLCKIIQKNHYYSQIQINPDYFYLQIKNILNVPSWSWFYVSREIIFQYYYLPIHSVDICVAVGRERTNLSFEVG